MTVSKTEPDNLQTRQNKEARTLEEGAYHILRHAKIRRSEHSKRGCIHILHRGNPVGMGKRERKKKEKERERKKKKKKEHNNSCRV